MADAEWIEEFDGLDGPIEHASERINCTRCETPMPTTQFWLSGEHWSTGDYQLCSRCLRDLAHIIDQRTARGA